MTNSASSTSPPTSHGRLVREQCVGVLVDFLTGLLVGVRTIERERFDASARGYALSLKALDVPYCVLGDEGGFRGTFFPIIDEAFADAPRFGRYTPSAWRSGGFRDWVLAQDRRQIVLGGISLDNCTLLTALDMLAEGLDVHVVVDVCGADSALAEAAALARLVQAGAVPHNWTAFACEAMGDWQSPQAAAIGELLMRHSPYGALGVAGAQA